MTDKPNLFKFATSELSQDAFLCWLLAWAKSDYAKTDVALHATGCKFVRSIMTKCGEPLTGESLCIKNVWKQHENIDILAEFSQGRKKYVLVIEDKVNTSIHGDQLSRYKNIIEKDFPNHEQLLVYLKTGAISRAAEAGGAGYNVYSGRELLNFLDSEASKINNNIFMDFHEHLTNKVSRYEAFKEQKIDEWTESWDAWEGFFCELKSEFGKLGKNIDWCYAANQSGGELVAYWGSQKYKDSDGVYLEIHHKKDKRSFLAFKICGIPEEKNKSEVRWDLYSKLMESAKKPEYGWGGKVDKPARFGSGNTMIFCQTVDNDCWLAKDAKGKLDMEKTIQNLKKAEEILCDAIR